MGGRAVGPATRAPGRARGVSGGHAHRVSSGEASSPPHCARRCRRCRCRGRFVFSSHRGRRPGRPRGRARRRCAASAARRRHPRARGRFIAAAPLSPSLMKSSESRRRRTAILPTLPLSSVQRSGHCSLGLPVTCSAGYQSRDCLQMKATPSGNTKLGELHKQIQTNE